MKKIKKLGTFEENMKWMDDIEKFNKKSTLTKGLGWFEDPVLGECNIEKTLKERREAEIDEYEAFNRMYDIDGLNGESERFRKL
jgi:hypothetical protein